MTKAIPPVAAVLALALALGGCGGDDPTPAASERTVEVEVAVRHSRFQPASFSVPVGTAVRFVVRNDDPIDHELIVGDDEVHRRHETGTEAHHGAVPGEVSVPGGGTAGTTFRFDTPGQVVFACHLPGHLAYGMRGVVQVTTRT